MSSTTQRTAIVTGAARGIGAATAKRLAADGHAVAVLDLDESACADTVSAITAAGGAGHRRRRRRQPTEQVGRRRSARVADELGAPTILVNNAGIIRDNLIFKMTDDDWDAVMNVHLRGSFLMTQAVQAHMIDAEVRPHRQPLLDLGAGQPRPGQLLRRQGRAAGLHQDPRHRAGQVRRHRQRRRAGLHRHRHDPPDGRADGGQLRGLHRGAAAAQIPVGRVGQPEDIAATISFLGQRARPASSPARSSTSPAARRTDQRAAHQGWASAVQPVEGGVPVVQGIGAGRRVEDRRDDPKPAAAPAGGR